MPVERLGKIHLHWCDECNVPLVEEGECGICGEKGRDVEITPPGDVRPAFKKDIDLIRKTIEMQWGDGYSEDLIGKDKVILLNKSPHLDRMDEVIVDGRVIGNLRYNVLKQAKGKEPYEFILRPWKGLPAPEKGYVKVDEGAVEPISDGGSVLIPGIIELDEDLEKGDETIVIDPGDNVIAAGSAYQDSDEMINNEKGKGIKSRWRADGYSPKKGGQRWEDALKSNENILQKKKERAVKFIHDNIEQHDLPVAVAYSGGKDSLATLHLLLDSNIEPDMIFVDTGIELPETVKNVEKVAEKHDLTLHYKEADSGYWKNIDHFGPSARDYRWCCKTCKLGPTARMISEHYPGGVLSFIGQRRYESRQRMQKGSVWENPWVPGQKSASPIQEWTALHVWMYLFSKEASYNPLYEEGFERVGCWVCPASDLAEFDFLRSHLDDFDRFEEKLNEHMEKADLPEEWKELGLWRWRDIPKEMEIILKEERDISTEKLSTCESEGIEIPAIEEMISDERTRELLQIFYPDLGPDLDKNKMKESLDPEKVHKIYRKARYCTECGICVGKCPNDALHFEKESKGLRLREDRCVSCQDCLGQCPVVRFDERVI